MILSFSVPAMMPMIQYGVKQSAGEDVGGARVKRQTIRARGTRSEALLAHDPIGGTIPYDLHLWWKSRTVERCLLGVVPCARVHVQPIEILHSEVIEPGGAREPIFRIERGAMIFWRPNSRDGQAFETEAYLDGFDSARDFIRFFVPNVGDVFRGILFRW